MLQTLSTEFSARGVIFVGINQDNGATPSAITDMLARTGVTFRQLRDPDHAISRLYQVNALPTTLVLDREGVIFGRLKGEIPELETILRLLLETRVGPANEAPAQPQPESSHSSTS